MKLDRFRGWGPWFAWASPACIVLAFVAFVGFLSTIPPTPTGQHFNPPPQFWIGVAVAAILLGAAGVAGLAVALDLEWIEHPVTHTGLTYVALIGAAVGTLAWLLQLILGPLGATQAANLATLVMPLGWGVYLVLINLVGMRARLLGRGLAYLGMTSGVLMLVTVVFALVLSPAFGVTFLPAAFLYCVWSIWLGFALRRPAAAPAPAPA